LDSSAHTRVPGFRTASGGFHFTRSSVETAFVAVTLRTSPHNPIAFPVTGAVVCFFGEVEESDFAHDIEIGCVKRCGSVGRSFFGQIKLGKNYTSLQK